MNTEELQEIYWTLWKKTRHCRDYTFDVPETNDILHLLYSFQKINISSDLIDQIASNYGDYDMQELCNVYVLECLRLKRQDVLLHEIQEMQKCLGMIPSLELKTARLDGPPMATLGELTQLRATDVVKIDSHEVALAYARYGAREFFRYLQPQFRADERIAHVAIQRKGSNYNYLSDTLKQNRNIILQAVRSFGANLLSVPMSYRDDKEIVKLGIMGDPETLWAASRRLRKDPEIVRLAVVKYPDNIRDALYRDPDIIWMALRAKPNIIKFLRVREVTQEMAQYVVNQDPSLLRFINLSTPGYKELVMSVLDKSPTTIKRMFGGEEEEESEGD